MGIEWLNENEGRSYPFVDAGLEEIPDELVVDMVLTGKSDELKDAYVSSIVVRGAIVSVAIASPSVGALAVFTANGPVKYRPYGLVPLRDGVGGYVSFGVGIEANLALDKRTMRNVVYVDPGCLKPLNDSYVSSLGKFGVRDDQALRGIVKLAVGSGVTLTHAGQVITIGLDEELARDLTPKCSTKAVFDECGSPPVRSINGVTADEDGKITLEFSNG